MHTTNGFVGPNLSEAREITRHLTDLLRNEQGAMVNFLLALAEFDGRRMWAEMGYASVFDYLVRELRLSKSAAFYRKTAAALVQRYPEIADALAEGRLCMTSVGEVAKVITDENVLEILPRFYGLSSREAKEVAAALMPEPSPPRREVVTLVPVAAPAPKPQPRLVSAPELELAPRQPAAAPELVPAPEPAESAPVSASRLPPREEVQPLTATLRRVHYTVTKRWLDKLQAAKDALSHSIPDGDAEKVLEAALDALLEKEAKRKGLLVKNPRQPRTATTRIGTPAPESSVPTLRANGDETSSKSPRKAVPIHVRRAVLKRDEARCQARLHDGTICGSAVRIQFDHVVPDALGGPSTTDNGRILCAAHNREAARRVFGDEWIDLFARPGK